MIIQLPNTWNADEAHCEYVGLCNNDSAWEIRIRFHSEGIAAGAARVELQRADVPIEPTEVESNTDTFLRRALQVLTITAA